MCLYFVFIYTKSMNKINSDIFNIILSFLKPTELVRSSLLNKFSRNSSLLFIKNLLKEYKTESLDEMVCPKCGDWVINEENYSKDVYFKDILGYLVQDQQECLDRIDCIKLWFETRLSIKLQKRKRLLCIDCEYYEQEPYDYPIFRYRGCKDYKIVTIYNGDNFKSWSFLYFIEKDVAYWNDYLKIDNL